MVLNTNSKKNFWEPQTVELYKNKWIWKDIGQESIKQLK